MDLEGFFMIFPYRDEAPWILSAGFVQYHVWVPASGGLAWSWENMLHI